MRVGFFLVAALTISLTATLVVSELFVRLVAPQPASWLAIYRSHPELPFFAMQPDRSLHVDTGETEWTVLTDDRGFRRPSEPPTSPTPPPPGQCTAIWLGDSFTFGHGVEYEESFVGRVAQRTPRVTHLNTAVAGYGPVQYRHTLAHLGEGGTRFDWVFAVSYVGNDFHDTQWDKNPRVSEGILGNEGGLKSFLKRRLHLYRLLSATYHRFDGGNQNAYAAIDEQLASAEAWQGAFLTAARDRWGAEMRAIKDLVEARGGKVAFLVLPTRAAAAAHHAAAAGSLEPASGSDVDPARPVEEAVGMLEEMGARYLDLTPVVGERPPAEVFFPRDGHLNPEANQRVADEILREFDLRCQAT
ncbi:MAG: hypothetical protein NXI30_05710 [bacterium]|nr:hypothetical protein [bacterium]